MTLSEKISGGITRIQIIPRGYAISVNEEGGAFLLPAQAKELAGDEYFEAPMDYHQYIIARIPSQLWPLDG